MRVKILLALALCSTLTVQADEPVDEAPDLELLEFLGEWETDDGQWVDPINLLAVPDTDLDGGDR